MLSRCAGQVRSELRPARTGFISVRTGLDYAAVIALAKSYEADTPLFYDLLPAIEGIIVHGPSEEDGESDPEVGWNTKLDAES